MKAHTLIERYETFCPQDLSMAGDISGLQIGSLDKDIQRIMIALDVRETTVAEAIREQVDLIIVKHAPIFKPLKDLVATSANQLYLDLIKHDIAVYVSHTNIDVVPGGLNDWFCEKLGLTNVSILHETQPGYGIGRVGDLAPMSFQDLADQVRETFGLDSIRLVSYDPATAPVISRMAICGGSGQSFYQDALDQGAQVYITGDIYYHTAQDMLTQGLLALDPGHHIEVLFVDKLAELFSLWREAEGWDVEVLASQANTNPFSHR